MTNDKVSQALQWLDDEGWSELIDPRWTLEVYHELQTSKLNLSDADIREALDIVVFDKPDYNPANNERLVRGMTEESPKYRDYIKQMQQCKAEAEKEHPKHKGFHDLSEPHERAMRYIDDMCDSRDRSIDNIVRYDGETITIKVEG